MEWIIKAIEKAIEVPLDDAFGFFFCTVAGVIVNWIWKCKKDGIKLSAYWLDDVRSTFWVFAGALAAFLTTVIIEPGVGKATYFAIGIAADSMIGRPPLPMAVQTEIARLQTSETNANQTNSAIASAVVAVAIDRLSNDKPVDTTATDAATEIVATEIGSVIAGQTGDKPSAS